MKRLFLLFLTFTYALGAERIPRRQRINQAVKLEQKAPANAMLAHQLEQVLEQKAIEQLHQTGLLLTSISGTISKGSVKSKQTIEILNHIKQINSVIFALLDNSIRTKLGWNIIPASNVLIKYSTTLVAHNFKNAIPIKDVVAQFSTKTVKVPLVVPANLLAANDKRLIQLRELAQNFGLTWYNHFFRGVDQHILTPIRRYDLVRRSILAAGIIATGICAWEAFHKKSFEEGLPKPFTDLFAGNIADMKNGHMQYDELGPIKKLEYLVGEKSTPITAGLVTAVATALAYEYQNILPEVKKWTQKIANTLRGGEYLHNIEKFNKNNHIRLSDLCGQEEVKEYFSMLVHYLENPDYYDKQGLTPAKGILCVGDSRTGKTFAVKALAGELEAMRARSGKHNSFNFMYVHAADFNNNDYGFYKILQFAQRVAPCIVFIDEIHLLSLQEGGNNQVLSEFLIGMSNLFDITDPRNQVIIIGATNKPENMADALRKPGRFGKEIRFEFPHKQNRFDYINKHFTKKGIDSAHFNIDELAQYTQGVPFEGLASIINSALLNANSRNQMLTQKHILDVLHHDVYHILPTFTKTICSQELDIVSAHFAGQVVALKQLNANQKIAAVTIKQVKSKLTEEKIGAHLQDKNHKNQEHFQYGKLVLYTPNDTINVHSKQELIAMIDMLLAGFIAEEILTGSCGYSCHSNDMQQAFEYALQLVAQGINLDKAPKSKVEQINKQADELIEREKIKVEELLKQNKNKIVTIQNALKREGTLSEKMVKQLIG